jgi:hypothetical protein
MDLVAIAQSVWRFKLATIPVILLAFVGVVYMGALKPATYQADASYILMAPPTPPTADQIQKDPALGRINTNNPYLRFGDLSVVVDLLTQSMATDAARQMLVNQGADPRYTLAPSADFGASAPIIQISGVGSSAYSAIRSAQLVSKATIKMLYDLQRAQGTNSAYMITTLAVSTPTTALLQVSSKLRSVIAVLALGAILLFVVVSTMSGLAARRASRSKLGTADDALEERPAALPHPIHPSAEEPRVALRHPIHPSAEEPRVALRGPINVDEPTVASRRAPVTPGGRAMTDSGTQRDGTRSGEEGLRGSPTRVIRALAWRR